MQSAVDQAITKAAASEAVFNTDTENVASIQQAIQNATAPLAPAEAKLATDAALYKRDLLALAAAATAAADAIAGDPAPADAAQA